MTNIEKSGIPPAKQIAILKIIDELADYGILKASEFISKIQDAFADDPISVESIIEIVNSILQTLT